MIEGRPITFASDARAQMAQGFTVRSTESITVVIAAILTGPRPSEVLDSQQSAESRERFQKLFQRKNFLLQQVNRSIAIIAHDIRDYYQNTNDGLPTVTTPERWLT